MRAVDTNVLVRLLVRDDVAQVRAAETFVEMGISPRFGGNDLGARRGI